MVSQVDESACDLLGDFFAVYANATRMRMFCALQQGEKTVTEIAAYAAIALPNASQHLRLMRDKGAVVAHKRGQTVTYRITDPRFLQAAALIRQALLDRMRDQGREAVAISSRRTSMLKPG
jgi:ArsR family transcriptional regulator